MENSIEEDIKILESIIKVNNDYLEDIENQTINQKEIKAIKHILSDYKRVLKENKTKDKIIDEMADWLYGDDTSFGNGKLKEVNTKEKIVQFFENRTKNE